jgi:hypothetical protein
MLPVKDFHTRTKPEGKSFVSCVGRKEVEDVMLPVKHSHTRTKPSDLKVTLDLPSSFLLSSSCLVGGGGPPGTFFLLPVSWGGGGRYDEEKRKDRTKRREKKKEGRKKEERREEYTCTSVGPGWNVQMANDGKLITTPFRLRFRNPVLGDES